MMLALSKLIPVRMTSNYRCTLHVDGEGHQIRSVWWQWRGRVYRHQVTTLS